MKYQRVCAWALAAFVLASCSKGSDPVTPPPAPECPSATPLTLEIPPNFPELPPRPDNPLTVEGVALGRRLFYDPILSGDSSQACSQCHIQQNAFGDTRRFSVGIHGIKGTRHAPTIVNPGWIADMFWDGRADGLEGQAREPVPNPIEMDLPWPDAIDRLERHPDYPALFCAAFGDKRITQDRVVKAIAQFERTFISANSRYDRVLRGEATFSAQEQMGFDVFRTERGDCFHCHDEIFMATSTFHNTGLDSVVTDEGRSVVTGNPADIGKFKSATLRNVEVSPPYMHDGRFATLEEVIAHYNMGFHDSDDVDPLIRARLTRTPMTQEEIDALIAFLHTLTDPDFLFNPALSDPFPGGPAVATPGTSAR
ncbi:MAG TPA: cytochrome c peroxidase [Candidatus Krumholzibacteria bacterium]|nr:cytochrome c peroxidase [Candidatus Krumholzibacteria bacterium]